MRISWNIDMKDFYWKDIRYFLDAPSWESNTGIIFVPGWSWEYEKRWQKFANQVVNASHYILWFEGWKDNSEDKTKLPCKEITIEKSHVQIQKMLDILESKGCEHIWVVWKSAGWAMVGLLDDPRIKSMSLWAPPFKLSQKSVSLEGLIKVPFWEMISEWKKAPEVKIDRPFLESIKIPTQFIHAQDDKVVPIENLFDIQGYLDPEVCRVQAIMEWGHSYKALESQEEVFRKTLEFFNQTLSKWMK